ncbi:MAG: hypothetical protein BWZ03_00107 [bacterium ADurb.BinA186]|nr:MAG: hypothetical protein BWZ03_00107 [bacterium ADurb.BinA186]
MSLADQIFEVKNNEQRRQALDFGDHPSKQSLAKEHFVSYYLKVYFPIVESILRGNGSIKAIRYIDLFSGVGKSKNGDIFVPLSVLRTTRTYDNVTYFFNDKYVPDVLRDNILKDPECSSQLPRITISQRAGSEIDVSSLFGPGDAVISYVDSFGHQCGEPETVARLIANPFSDCLLFLNLDHFFRFLQTNKNKDFVRFFGSDQHVREAVEKRMNLNNSDFVDWFLKDYQDRLRRLVHRPIYMFPVFFRDEPRSDIMRVVILISKNKTGIERIREKFVPVCDEDGNVDDSEQNFCIDGGRLFASSSAQQHFFDKELRYQLKEIIDVFPSCNGIALGREDLVQRLDQKSLEQGGCLSIYSPKLINSCLAKIERAHPSWFLPLSPKRRKGRYASTIVQMRKDVI